MSDKVQEPEELRLKPDASITELKLTDLTTLFTILANNIVTNIMSQFQGGEQISQQLADQISNQIEKVITQVSGANVSDTVSRLISEGIIKSDVDIGFHERLRSTGARGDAAFGFKTNVVDFLGALNSVSHQGQGQRYIDQMTQTALTHFGESLKDERIRKSEMNYFNNAKLTQEQAQKDAALPLEKKDDLNAKLIEALTSK